MSAGLGQAPGAQPELTHKSEDGWELVRKLRPSDVGNVIGVAMSGLTAGTLSDPDGMFGRLIGFISKEGLTAEVKVEGEEGAWENSLGTALAFWVKR